MSQGPGYVVIVRRGLTEVFEWAQATFGQGPSPIPVMWDRRVRDRRVIIRDDVTPERRRGERRAPQDITSWNERGYIVVRTPGSGRAVARRVPDWASAAAVIRNNGTRRRNRRRRGHGSLPI